MILKLAEQTPIYAYRKFSNQYNSHVYRKLLLLKNRFLHIRNNSLVSFNNL